MVVEAARIPNLIGRENEGVSEYTTYLMNEQNKS